LAKILIKISLSTRSHPNKHNHFLTLLLT